MKGLMWRDQGYEGVNIGVLLAEVLITLVRDSRIQLATIKLNHTSLHSRDCKLITLGANLGPVSAVFSCKSLLESYSSPLWLAFIPADVYHRVTIVIYGAS